MAPSANFILKPLDPLSSSISVHSFLVLEPSIEPENKILEIFFVVFFSKIAVDSTLSKFLQKLNLNFPFDNSLVYPLSFVSFCKV